MGSQLPPCRQANSRRQAAASSSGRKWGHYYETRDGGAYSNSRPQSEKELYGEWLAAVSEKEHAQDMRMIYFESGRMNFFRWYG